MTIQQQLAALGPTFEVDGVKWDVYLKELAILRCYTGASYVTIMQRDSELCAFDLHFYGRTYAIEPTPTIEAACRKALAICRERVAELAGALGMGVYDEIKEKANKWDALDEQVGKYYEPEPDGGQGFVNEYQLDTIGEICATHLGYM